jgi:hypothetical protein
MRVIRFALIACVLGVFASDAAAQTTVRVTHDKSKIWTTDFGSEMAVVDAGTQLTVSGEKKDWYEVVVPGTNETGFIYKGLVERQHERKSARESDSGSDAPRSIGFAGFGQFAYTRFAAQNSFQAVTGNAGGTFAGAGAEVRFGNLFVNGSADHFTKTGQRVLVIDREVFGLGVPDTITLTPIKVTTGWRFTHENVTPYVGGGAGRILYKETSDFADAGENIESRFASYHVLGGVEFRSGWVGTAFEVEYSRVPNALGVSGASAAFQETDLGGIAARVKILVGR